MKFSQDPRPASIHTYKKGDHLFYFFLLSLIVHSTTVCPPFLKDSSTRQQAISPLALAKFSRMVDGRSPASLDGARDRPPGSRSTTMKVKSRMAQSRYSRRRQRKTLRVITSFLLGPLKNITSGIPKMTCYFYEHDTKGKRHLCLIFHALGLSVEDLWLTNIHHGGVFTSLYCPKSYRRHIKKTG